MNNICYERIYTMVDIESGPDSRADVSKVHFHPDKHLNNKIIFIFNQVSKFFLFVILEMVFALPPPNVTKFGCRPLVRSKEPSNFSNRSRSRFCAKPFATPPADEIKVKFPSSNGCKKQHRPRTHLNIVGQSECKMQEFGLVSGSRPSGQIPLKKCFWTISLNYFKNLSEANLGFFFLWKKLWSLKEQKSLLLGARRSF